MIYQSNPAPAFTGSHRGYLNIRAAWLQHIEQGRAAWSDSEKKARLRRTLVWNRPAGAQLPQTSTQLHDHLHRPQ